MLISIIIPALNEEKRILPTLEKIAQYLNQQSYSSEVIVVDDGSSDHTPKIVQTFAQKHPRFRLIMQPENLGKGAAVKKGMLVARGDHRLFSDADLSTPIEELEKFLSYRADVVIGSRRVKGCRIEKRQPFFREAAGRIFSVLVRCLTLRGFIDTQCGFKLFTAQAAQEIFSRQTISRFGFDVEVLFIAQLKGFRIIEAPVTWIDSPFTRVRFFRDSTRMFLDLVRIRLNHFRRRYQ
ncbi:MAG: Undecaprenyl-phosphate mannosyltransferase [Elusimicrobia bacterium]|nr:Undecaprenyl-phosphate mannosyltransferase [Elusimicrobiota bacterium]